MLPTNSQVTRKRNRIRLHVESLEDRCVPANHAPIGTAVTLTIPQGQPYTLATADFGFTDPNDMPANNFSAVRITTLPTAGFLNNNGMPVGMGTSVSVADIAANHLVYSPDLMGNGSAYLTFQVQDNGGTADGGVDTDPSAKTMTLQPSSGGGSSVNHAPTIGSVMLDTSVPKTNDRVTAQVLNAQDPDGDPITFQFVWSVNGQVVRTTTTTNTTDSLDLSQPGNGNKGDMISVSVTPIDAAASGAAVAASVTVANSPPVFDPITFTSPAIADDDVPDGTSFFTNGMVLGQLHATDADNDPLTYTTPGSPSLNDPANFLTVTSDGKVVVANAAGLNGYFNPNATNGTQYVLPVGVTDGTLEDASNFTLNIFTDWIPQNAIYIETNTGAIYQPDTSAQMLDNLRAIRAAGQTVELLIIKGHAGGGGIQVGSDQNTLSTFTNVNGQMGVGFFGTDITALLQSVTDNTSTIRFRGCYTADFAARVQQALGNGTRCTGAIRYAIGIPGTAWIIGVTR
ncbi:MAG: hypothetical protein EXR98_01690 [Gemmataceae bacterium]|nr:hypothetical protein [Gemmataceae bacterium]